MMNKLFTLSTLVLALAMTAAVEAGVKEDVDALLAKLPGKDAKAETEIEAALIALGQEGVAELCSRLTPAEKGGDQKVRFALNGLARHVLRADGESNRKLLEMGLIFALDSKATSDVKVFLLEQLERVGANEAIDPVTDLIADTALTDSAIRALAAIGGEHAAQHLIDAVGSVKGRSRIGAISALGRMRDERAGEAILGLVEDEDAEIRYASWIALARIGKPSTFPFSLVKDAMESSKVARERANATTAFLTYAGRLAEKGARGTAAVLCRELIEENSTAGQSHVACAALTRLVQVLGKDALPDLLAAVDSPELAVQAIALREAVSVPGAAATKAWAKKLASADAGLKVRIARMLAARGDPSAMDALKGLVNDADSAVQFAAIAAAAKLSKTSPVESLVSLYAGAEPKNRIALLAAFKRLGGSKAVLPVAKDAVGSNAALRVAAIETLAQWPDAASLKPLLAAAKKSDQAAERAAALSGYLRVALAARLERNAMLALYKDGLAVARDASEKKILLGGLGRLKMIESLEIIASMVDDDGLREDASRAAVLVSKPRKSGKGGLTGPRAIAALEKVIAATKNAATKKDAQAYVESIK